MAWNTVEINGDAAGTLAKDMLGQPFLDTSGYADNLETVNVLNGEAGRLRCSACSEGFDTADDAEGLECSDAAVCDDVDCPCDWSTDHGPAHRLTAAPLTWFHRATVVVDEMQDRVVVAISAEDPRGAFTMELRRIPDDAEHNAGQLIMYLPYPGMPGAHTSLTQISDSAFILGS